VTALDRISDEDYRSLAEFRYQIRRFLHFSEQVAREAHLEPRQYQLMLAVKGLTTHRVTRRRSKRLRKHRGSLDKPYQNRDEKDC